MTRGYIMMEALISGALLAVVLGTTLSLIASYRVEVTMAARRAEASALAMATADELMARSHTTGVQALAAVPGHPGFRSGWTIATTALPSTPPLPGANAVHRITVTIEYPSGQGTKTLVIERLKRKFPLP
ncbi:MAG: hypothetical protein A2138_05160 [Deltaproteobacteria bacterium RBG_16_71_12]|nr:MAG: hypothetical protein A2138_05160 [Deltaproteobacteria bacterium RBG_16_71_12]